MYTNPRPSYQNELYHHGVLGMHWGIRRYQPYRKGERVKGGKEVGKATKVEQRNETTKVTKHNSEDYNKRYEDELNRVKAGGVDKNIDNLIKKAKEKSENYKKDRSYQRYLADAKATNELDTALKDYMRSKGYSRYSPKEITKGINESTNEYNNAKKSYDDAVAKLDKMFNGSYNNNYYKKEFRELYNGERANKLRSQKYAAERDMVQAKDSIEFWKKEPMEHAMKSNNELYHHGILGMHWGVRRYQPYRKGNEVKGGKEIGKAAKVEQRSIADRVRKGMAAVNKIKKEIHKGKLEKAEYKYEMAQLKDAKKEVKKARRREAEERIRQRVREHREEQREERRLEEERKDRNLERARGIAESAAQVGTLLYGAYQLKKGMQERGLLGGNQNGTNSSTNSSPLNITRSGSNSSHSGPTHTLSTPASSSSSSSSNPHPLQIHTSGSRSAPSTLPTSLQGNSSSGTSLRNASQRATRQSITNNVTSAINKLKSKSNKTDEDRYALLGLQALQSRVNSASDDQFEGNGMGHLSNLTPEQLIRRQIQMRHVDEDPNFLMHHGVLGMHWGIRRYQPYRNGGRGIFVGVKTRKQQASFDSKHAKSLNESENFNDPKLGYEKLDDKESWLTNKKRHKQNMRINNANQDRYTKVVSPILATAGLKQNKDYPYLFTKELKDGSTVTAFASHENTPLKNVSGMAKTANKYISNKASYDKKFIDAFKKEYKKDKDRWSKDYGLDISGIKVGGVRVENDGSMMFSLYPKYGGIIDGVIKADGKIEDNWGYDD